MKDQTADTQQARKHFVLGMSRIARHWGFPRAMGAIFGALYLSPGPLSLDELVEQVGVTKGAVSTNVRSLERLKMVRRHVKTGERKDYYTAETDFWAILRNILREREGREFDNALKTVGESMDMLKGSRDRLAPFYRERISAMEKFFGTLDSLVAMAVAFDEMRMGSLKKFLGRGAK